MIQILIRAQGKLSCHFVDIFLNHCSILFKSIDSAKLVCLIRCCSLFSSKVDEISLKCWKTTACCTQHGTTNGDRSCYYRELKNWYIHALDPTENLTAKNVNLYYVFVCLSTCVSMKLVKTSYRQVRQL